MNPGEWKPDREVPPLEELARAQLARHINTGLKVIVGTRRQWKPGEIMLSLASCYLEGGRIIPHNIEHPFRVIAETTFEEWLANTPPYIPGRKPTKEEARGYRFFEVATD